jgi:hypothetical protein
MLRGDNQLIKVVSGVDRDKSGQNAGLLGDNDGGIRHQLVAPALAPPRHACGKVNPWIGLLPGSLPQLNRCVLVLGTVGTQVKGSAHVSKAMMNGLITLTALPFRQLQLNAAVTLVRILRRRVIERLEFGKAGRNESLGRHAERHQILHDGNRPR